MSEDLENEFCNKHDAIKPCKKCLREYGDALRQANKKLNQLKKDLGF